jgi:hypothetical protein
MNKLKKRSLVMFLFWACGGLMAQAHDSKVNLPKVWNATFVKLFSRLCPDKTIVATLYRGGDSYLVGCSVTGLEQTWYKVKDDGSQLMLIPNDLVKELKDDDAGVVVEYDRQKYHPVDGFGRFPTNQMQDVSQ